MNYQDPGDPTVEHLEQFEKTAIWLFAESRKLKALPIKTKRAKAKEIMIRSQQFLRDLHRFIEE